MKLWEWALGKMVWKVCLAKKSCRNLQIGLIKPPSDPRSGRRVASNWQFQVLWLWLSIDGSWWSLTGILHEDAWGFISKIIQHTSLWKKNSRNTHLHLCARHQVSIFRFLCHVDHFLASVSWMLLVGGLSHKPGTVIKTWRPHRSWRVAAVDRKAVFSCSNLSIQKWKSFKMKSIYVDFQIQFPAIQLCLITR